MSNIQALPLRDERAASDTRQRGKILHDLLRAQRWSNREAARTLGLSHTYVGARVRGDVDLSVGDIQAFAGMLAMTEADLFVKLLGLDSDQQPIGSQSALVTLLSDRPRKARDTLPRTPAIVSQMRA